MDLSTYTVHVNRFKVDVIADDHYIKQCLSNGYEWDSWMRQDIPHIYKPGTDILDIGGNIGWNALMFSDYGPVHTFEPLFHPVVSKNVSQNETQNPIKVYPIGLSNVSSEVMIYKPKPSNEGLTNYGGCSMHHADDKLLPGYPVKIERLDDVYFGTPSFIKLDVEHHEYQAILGALETIKRGRPSMYIEIFDFENSPIVPLMKELGYSKIIPRPEHNYLFVQ